MSVHVSVLLYVARYEDNVVSTSQDAMQRDFEAQKTQLNSELRSMQVDVDSWKVKCALEEQSRSRDLEAHTAREADLEGQRSFLMASEN